MSFSRLAAFRCGFAVLCIGVGATLGGPETLAAQTVTYYACYVPLSGSVYRIKEPDTPQQCGSSMKKGVRVQHVEFSWTSSIGAGIDHGSLGGLLDDDHPQYLLSEGLRTSLDGFAVQGTFGQGSIPASGPGSRFMWYPRKAALRAGFVQNDDWDDANIGSSSVAFMNGMASGIGAAAIGLGAKVSGYASVGLGSARVSGDESFAAGRLPEASGSRSIALGENAKASGGNATAIGPFTTASGSWSTALGYWVDANGYYSMAIGRSANANQRTGAIVISAGTQNAMNNIEVKAVANGQFVARASRFWFGNNESVTAPSGQLIATSTGAHLTTGGTWVNSSDVNRKANFAEVDGEDVLRRLSGFAIRTWNYRDEDASIRHMGPTAQDFRAAFGLGEGETSIATIDADGVSMAAIQALEKRTARLASDNESLRRLSEELGQQNDELRAQLQELAARIDRITQASPDTR